MVGNAPHRLPRAGRRARASPWSRRTSPSPARSPARCPSRSTSATGRRGSPTPTVASYETVEAALAAVVAQRSTPTTRASHPDAAPARPAQRRRLAARGRRDAGRAARSRSSSTLEPRRRVDRAHQPVRLRAQDRGRRRHRPSYDVRASGRTSASPRGRPRWRCDGRRARRRTPVDAGRADRGRPRRRARSRRADRRGCSTPTPWCSPCPPARRATSTITGVSEARLTSLRRQRHAWAAKFVAAYDRAVLARHAGRTRCPRARACSARPGRSRRACCPRWCRPSGTPRSRRPTPATRTREALDADRRRCTDREATSPLATWTRLWGTDPWTQGYVTNWRPGDVEAVGPLHGTHEPPFYVCGSDQWVAGYMEGAVRTGRAAAAASTAPRRRPDGLRPDRRAAQHRAR